MSDCGLVFCVWWLDCRFGFCVRLRAEFVWFGCLVDVWILRVVGLVCCVLYVGFGVVCCAVCVEFCGYCCLLLVWFGLRGLLVGLICY